MTPTRNLLATGLCVLAGCRPERWTDRPALPRDVDGVTYVYREHATPRGAPGELVTYTINVGAVGSDVVFTSSIPGREAHARDDGRPPDREAADNLYTGVYRVTAHRADPQWLFKTRPPPVGDVQRALPPDQEGAHPFAHRRFVAGGAGGAGDNASVCPPGHVVTGLRHRLDAATRTLAQVAPVCRALPRAGMRVPGNLVEAAGWGEEVKAPLQTAECPQGSAVVGDAHLWLRPWRGLPVVAAVELRCALVRDGTRRTVATLSVGERGDDDGLRFRCAETDEVRPVPLAVGVRVISGMRLDALGLVCDVGPVDRAVVVADLRFAPRPGRELELGLPLASPPDGPLFARATTDRAGTREGSVFVLPPTDATLALEPMSARGVDIVAPLDGCVVSSTPSRVRLAEGDCGAAPHVLLELSGGAMTAAPGMVRRGSVVGTLPVSGVVWLRATSVAVVGHPREEEDLPAAGFVPANAEKAVQAWEIPPVGEASPTPVQDPAAR